MKWLDDFKKRLALVGFMAAIVIGGGKARADFTFGEPTNLGPTVNSSSLEGSPSISSDGLELYLTSIGESGAVDLFVTTRETIDDNWGTPVTLGLTVNSPAIDIEPYILADGLQLYFESRRSGNFSSKADLWMTTRTTTDGPWGEPMNLGSVVNSTGGDSGPSISSDGLALFFCSSRVGNQMDLFVTKRVTINDDWEGPTNLGAQINTSQHEWSPSTSSDGLILLFTRGPEQSGNIWMAKRETILDNWSAPIELDSPINSTFGEFPGNISTDGRTLYFESNRPFGFGDWDVWQAPIVPYVDFNADGIVDSEDMCIMVDHWGEDYSLCDIGPMPWGDGVVDIEDLKVLAEHFFQEAFDPTLVAHWPFDETEGMVVGDAVGDNQAFAVGDPVWQPDGGQVGGALLFDGVDDFISAPAVFNPADGPFSVLAWIKGGAPGQAILSQADGVSWLCTDSVEGCLMTELKNPGRGGAPLLSQTFITDGDWRRIGFVWDGSYRRLFVDGTEVAQDTEPLSDLENAEGALYLSADSELTPSTFFSGLMDDIRIYNRAVKH